MLIVFLYWFEAQHLSLSSAMITPEFWAQVFFCILLPADMRAFRALAGYIYWELEMVRQIVRRRQLDCNNDPIPRRNLQPIRLRMSWYSPWVGWLRIRAPHARLGNVALQTFIALWRENKDGRRGANWVDLHGASSDEVFTKVFFYEPSWLDAKVRRIC